MELPYILSLLILHLHLCLAATAAPKISQSPGDSYVAIIDPSENIYNTSGSLFITSSSASPADIELTLFNLPSSGGPFTYHIHTNPVHKDPATGLRNCTAALAHLDPYDRGETPPCDPAAPQSCQIGDLAGKHGAVPAGLRSFVAHYAEDYISTDVRSSQAFVGGAQRSIVVHFANKTRIACANLVVLPDAVAPSSPSSSSAPAPTETNSSGGSGCTSAALYAGGNGSLPAMMVVASGTAPAVRRPSGLLLAGMPTTVAKTTPTTTAATSLATYVAAGVSDSVVGMGKMWSMGLLGVGVVLLGL